MPDHISFFFRTRSSFIIGLFFTFNSFLFGNWVTRIPTVKNILDLSEIDLGLALLGAPLGAMLMLPFVGWYIARLGAGPATLHSALIHFAVMILPAYAENFWHLALIMVLFGSSNALMDISMNSAAAATEKKLGKLIMSSCHGMWSIGAMAGSLMGSIMIGLGVSLKMHLFLIVTLLIGLTLVLHKSIKNYREERKPGEKIFALPKGPLLILAIMAFCIMASEGAIADWSAVYMDETLNSSPFLTGIAYAGYALLMTLGRFSGDAIIPVLGQEKVVKWGGATAAAGLGGALLIGTPAAAIFGFSLAGLGFSCIIPVLFSSASMQPGYSPGTGIASVTTIGYTGFLVGPPLIGFLAEMFSLPVGLGFVVFCSAMVSILAVIAKFK
jgi:MFS family permease